MRAQTSVSDGSEAAKINVEDFYLACYRTGESQARGKTTYAMDAASICALMNASSWARWAVDSLVLANRYGVRGSLSRNSFPEIAPASEALASQMMVSAPSSAVRRIRLVMLRKVGNADATPGVSAQPGCIALTMMLSARHCCAHNSLNTVNARLARA